MKEEERLEILAEKVLKFLGPKNVFVNISLIDGRTMRQLNRKFLGNDSSTDVLSFEVPEDFPAIGRKRHLGEIYLNPTYIKKHKEDINLIMIHGLLHLLGYNHELKGDRIRMENLENKLLSWLGIKF